MASQNDQDLQFWDNPNSPNYNLVNQGQPRTLLERAMPILVVILTIMVAILLPLAISNHVKVSNNEGKTQPFTFVSFVRNHVKLMRVINSRRGFSKGTVLCGGY